MKKFNLQNLCHYADILAIPFFFLTFWYFYNLKNKTLIEYLIMLFGLSGFIMDTIFVFLAFFIYDH
jgi:hypothetical protein